MILVVHFAFLDSLVETADRTLHKSSPWENVQNCRMILVVHFAFLDGLVETADRPLHKRFR